MKSKPQFAKYIGEKIKLHRDSHLGLSQVKLSESAGIDPFLLSRIESGKQLPRLDTLLKIAGALHVSIAQLLPEGEKRPASTDHISREIVSVIAKGSLSEKSTLLKLLRTYFSKD